MAIGSGLGGSLQAKGESSYGTAALAATSYEIDKESLNRNQKSMVASGLAAGRYVDLGSRRIVTTEDAGGSVDLPVQNSGFGRILNMLLGGGGTPTLDSGTSYTQTHTIGDLAGKSLTWQKSVPTTDGAANLFTYKGSKCTGATFDCGIDSLLSVSTDWDSQQQDTTVATFGAASYPSAMVPFHFAQNSARYSATPGALIVPITGGSALDGLRKFSLKIDRKMADDRYYFNNALATDGSSGVTKSEPLLNDQMNVSGTLDLDYTPTAKTQLYDLYKSNAPFALTIAFTGATIVSTFKYQIAFQFTQCYIDGESPQLQGPGLIGNSIPFVALGDGTNSALTVIYRSTDSLL